MPIRAGVSTYRRKTFCQCASGGGGASDALGKAEMGYLYAYFFRIVRACQVEAALRLALQAGGVRDAASEVATAFGLPRRDVYALALKLAEQE